MWWVTIALGVAAFLGACLTNIGIGQRRDTDDLIVATALTWVWAVELSVHMVLAELFPTHRLLDIYAGPALDVVFCLMVAAMYRRRRAGWKMTVFMLGAFQLTAHVAFGISDKSPDATYLYKAALNISFLAQVLSAASPGISHGVRRLFHSLPSRGMVRRQRLGGQP